MSNLELLKLIGQQYADLWDALSNSGYDFETFGAHILEGDSTLSQESAWDRLEQALKG